MKSSLLISLLALCLTLVGCKTKSEVRREQELEKVKQDVREAKMNRADLETVTDELRADLTRLSNNIEEQTELQKGQLDDLKKELLTVGTRIQALEQRAAAEDTAAKAAADSRSKQTLENGKRLYDEEKYDDAVDILKGVIANKPHTDDARHAQLLVADCYFASHDYASAALEYEKFKKDYPKDSMVPNATYRQAQSFKNLGKKTEAKLFYQELIDRFPKNPLASKAKQEMKHLKAATP
jgi:TolA-binding protein